jgi:hypothetical protein
MAAKFATKLFIEMGKSHKADRGRWVVLCRMCNNSIGSSSNGPPLDETDFELKGVDR